MFKNKKKTQTRQRSALTNSSFRRNLSVSSPAIKRAHQQREVESRRQQDLLRLSKKHTKRLKAVLILASLMLILLAFRLTLRSTNVTGAQALSKQDSAKYQTYLNEYLANNTLANQSWSLDIPKLEGKIIEEFPELESAEISHNAPLGSSLKAKLSFRTPVYVWRDVSKQERFIDKNGVLFAENKMPVKTSGLVAIQDQSGLVAEAGDTTVSKQTLQFLGALPGELKLLYPRSKGSQPLKEVAVPLSTREVRVKPQGVGYFIKFNTNREVSKQAGELKVLLAHLKKRGITPKQYIDIRIATRAFYK